MKDAIKNRSYRNFEVCMFYITSQDSTYHSGRFVLMFDIYKKQMDYQFRKDNGPKTFKLILGN